MRHRLIDAALNEIGVKELPGAADNSPRILEYFAEIGMSWVKDDETAWCSASHNFIAKTSGYEYSGALDARSWLGIGIETTHPEKGDTVIFWRISPHGWQGHVGFYIRQRGNLIWTLGGNQSNQYKISTYPAARSKKYGLLGYRILRPINDV